MTRQPYTFADWQSGTPLPASWDAADAVDDGWVKAELDQFMRTLVGPPSSPPVTPEPPHEPEPPPHPEPEPPRPAGGTTTQAITTQQEKPATVTDIRTRVTYEADESWMRDLICNEDGKVKPGLTKNWSLFLENHPDMAGVFAFDAFKLRVMLMRRPPWEPKGASWTPRVLQDRDYSEAVMWLEARYMTPKVSNIGAVVQTVAEHAAFDRLREYLEGLEWDGQPRVTQFATDYLGVMADSYAPIVSERWLISSVARGLKPGCKVDTMPILEGPQGARKSTAIRVLYGDEFFTDELSDIGSKDAMMEMQGVWGLEVAEMHRFSQAETNQVKKFLTKQADRFRPPYGRSVIEAPRRVILNGTINPEGNAYLRDPTGARRFWPLTVGRIDIDAIARDRDQLWAEAVALFRQGRKWWLDQDEVATVEVEQAKRTDVDVWEDMISPMLTGINRVSQIEIFEHLNIPKKDAGWQHAARVGRIMKRLGWERYDDKRNRDRAMFRKVGGDSEDLGGGDW